MASGNGGIGRILGNIFDFKMDDVLEESKRINREGFGHKCFGCLNTGGCQDGYSVLDACIEAGMISPAEAKALREYHELSKECQGVCGFQRLQGRSHAIRAVAKMNIEYANQAVA